MSISDQSIMSEPSESGRFGEFGGRFVPETLVPACQELEASFREAWADPLFRAELDQTLKEYAGRPSMITECYQLSAKLGIRLVLKREDLNHTGSHKINNVLGQVLLAKRMGKKRIVAETGAGQHGVASATAAALMGMSCKVYMGAVDVERPLPVVSGRRRLRDHRHAAEDLEGLREELVLCVVALDRDHEVRLALGAHHDAGDRADGADDLVIDAHARATHDAVDAEVDRLALPAETERVDAHLEHAVLAGRDGETTRRDFVANVSHELRTPLTSIRALAELMRDAPDMDTAQRQQFLVLVQQPRRLAAAVQARCILQFLELSRLVNTWRSRHRR